MYWDQNCRIVEATPPAVKVNNGVVTVNPVDTIYNGVKFDAVTWLIVFGAMDVAATVLKAQESNVSNSGFADVPGAAFGGTSNDGVTANPALPGASDGNHIFAIHLAASGTRKRYQTLSITIGNGSTGDFVTVLAILHKAKELPKTAAMRGYTGEIFA